MSILVFTSTISDGTMRSIDGDGLVGRQNRIKFIKKCGLNPSDTSLHTLSYGAKNYCRYVTLGERVKGDGIIRESTIDADAVVVSRRNHAILLPLADCIGAVIYDPKKDVLMVSHLGRHNLEQNGGDKCINYMKNTHQIDPSRLKVWLSPAAGKKTYPLFNFQGRSLHEVALEQLQFAGVKHENVTISNINSAIDLHYYSHSEFLAGRRDANGRHAVLAIRT